MAASPAADSGGGRVVEAGTLPPWNVAEMPAPPPYSPRNALRIAGPGAIILGVSIGSGEWLIGPAATAQYSAALLWVATTSILLQWIFNEEACRYTLYTGEPITVGFMRTKPGPKFWGWYYVIASFMNNGWPGWAAAAATAIVAAIIGGVPGPEHAGQVLFWGYMTFFASLVLFLFGSRIAKTLEMAEWFMVAWILIFLVVRGLDLRAILDLGDGLHRLPRRRRVLHPEPQTGNLMGLIPQGADWLVIGGFAAYAGAGGVSNLAITNWVRDKSMGMSAHVGFIPAVVGGHKMDLAATGSVFEPTPENVRRFREWWKYIRFDQLWVWVVGCFLGMGLPALLTVQFIPPGTTIGGMAVAVRQAEGIASAVGGMATGARDAALVPDAADRASGSCSAPSLGSWTSSRAR